ncbi:intercellular adhesion molecule 1-like isoform X1 [Lates japonicus]
MIWLVVFGGLIACAGNPASATCQLKLTPPEVVVQYGDPFSVNCSSLSSNTKEMGWESPLGAIQLTSGVSFLTLKIKSTSEWEIPAYCYSNLDNGDQCVESLPVIVYKKPKDVVMFHPSPKGPMVEGKDYPINCDIVDVAPARNLSLCLHNENKILECQSFAQPHLLPGIISSVFDLTAHRNLDGTQIWCEAEQNFSPQGPKLPWIKSKPLEVVVLYPPTFNSPTNETLETAGRKIILDCNATGNPVPRYSWHLPEPLQQMNKNEKQLILTRPVQFPGTYSCTASNSQGTTTKYFTVIEAPRDRTTFGAIVGGFVALGVVLIIAGVLFVTPDGTFSLNKGSYLRGRPTSSGPV